jgi:hypothetical protein
MLNKLKTFFQLMYFGWMLDREIKEEERAGG